VQIDVAFRATALPPFCFVIGPAVAAGAARTAAEISTRRNARKRLM
jgi:hypothetical protein